MEVLSAHPGREWDVMVGPDRVCTSPCKGFAEFGRDIVLLSGEVSVVGATVGSGAGPAGIGPLLRAAGPGAARSGVAASWAALPPPAGVSRSRRSSRFGFVWTVIPAA